MMNCPSFQKHEVYSEAANYTVIVYEKALEDIVFLKKQLTKKEKEKEWVSPFTSVGYEYMGNRDNAAYRQQYLRMYNPMKKMRKASMKERSKKLFIKLKAKMFQSRKEDDFEFVTPQHNFYHNRLL